MAYDEAWRRWMLLCGVVWPSVEGRSSRFPGQQQGLVPRVSDDGVAAACPSTSGRGALGMAAMDAVGVRYGLIDEELHHGSKMTKEKLLDAIEGHVLGEAVLVAYFG